MIRLRELQVSDLEFLLEVRNHPSTRCYLENDSIFSLENAKEWFLKLECPWYIIESDNKCVGYIRTNSNNEVGVDIHPDHRRKGYARMAYTLFLSDKHFASLWVFDDNIALILYTELGFVRTGEIKWVRNRKYIKMILEK